MRAPALDGISSPRNISDLEGTMWLGALRGTALYWRLKTSTVRDVYRRVAGDAGLRARDAEVSFYRTHLQGFQPGDLIFDVGASIGDKTDVFLRLGARVVAVEPDEYAQGALRSRFTRWRVRPKPVAIDRHAVSDTEVPQTMWIDAPGSALNTLAPKWAAALRDGRLDQALTFDSTRTVPSTTLDRLIDQHGRPLFIKIDVEGHERHVIRGLTQTVPYVSFEVNLPEFRDEGISCIEHLDLLAGGTFNYTADCRRLALPRWMRAPEAISALEACREGSVEVFWASRTI
jgi:FkbM family methyltransferase